MSWSSLVSLRTTPHRRPPRTSDSVWQNDLGVIELGREKGRPQCDAHERTLEEDGERAVADAAKIGTEQGRCSPTVLLLVPRSRPETRGGREWRLQVE